MRHKVTILFLLLGFTALAQANQVSYQGILTNAGGDSLLSGTFDFSFSVFSTETGGTARWTEAHDDTEVENGVYSVLLGGTTALPDSIGATNWLQITVEGTVLTPRLPITADFRAIEARHAENADSVNHIPASSTPQPGHLLPLDNAGRFPSSVLPFTLDSVLAGPGLTGVVSPLTERGRAGVLDDRITIGVGAGTGITVNADNVEAVLGTSISTSEIEEDAVDSLALANDAVRSENIQNGQVMNVDLANNSVNSAKVADNSLTAADIVPDIVSSVDSVFNDGGNIDLIAGPNISIVPNDSANTITFSATSTTYDPGRCIEINGTTIDNIMDIFGSNCIDVDYDPVECVYDIYLDMDIEGDDCIGVSYDEATCTYELESLMNLIGGDCIIVEEGLEGCNWTISLDPDCIIHDTITVVADSVWDSELYARSFVVTPDGSIENARGHLTSDGKLELYGPGGDTVRINPNGTMDVIMDGVRVAGIDENGEMEAQSFEVIDEEGNIVAHITGDGSFSSIQDVAGTSGHDINTDGTWTAVQDGQIVAGLDNNGEIFARSFYVKNASGDTLAHIRSDGTIQGARVVVSSGGQTTDIQPGSVTTGNATSSTTSSASGVSVTGSSGGVSILPSGTWTAVQNNTTVAGLDGNGEIFAKSFYVKDPVSGDTLIHLTSDGQILVNGEPIGGSGEGEIITRQAGDATARMGGLLGFSHSEGLVGTGISTSGLTAADFSEGNGTYVNSDGTWSAEQNSVAVAGLQSNGEIHAKSFEVRDSAGGEILAHLDNDGDLYVDDVIADDVEVYGDLYAGNPLEPTGSGLHVAPNGTLGLFQSGNPVLDVALDTYLRIRTCMVMGTFIWGFDLDYVTLDGNLMVNGFFSAENFPGGMPPVVGEFLPTQGNLRPDVGTLLVIDRNSDAFIPCSESYQTSVIGVVSPADTMNAEGEIMTVTYGSTTWVPNGGDQPIEVSVRVKADAKYGSIKRGDLLTTSATPGHAMLASEPKLGTIVGKALESLESGTGEIKVMVTLQ